ncbi:LysR substrate-binding domain-containing protein [Ramlibacter tataouinensis]|uniref:Transcriptional regulator, LysR family-like protein n=1 Tax=Ramlibacter tataouinensis (strain ATCC BAA-407 / DSM 14655 / LMG 21543 / TTB310) TaxID=365046 RepID=F5XY30_RAMTT|nr:LysR substrate-binding domain-containing protein [Ramlibacter tataouinensis]AEG94355.1 transcriptional regulator, LysR family-like protein [Ramlibacter tataouinensis TTB310]
MHINQVDLNLLRLFDAVYRMRSVSRAAEQLRLTQPAASQGLTRLRGLLGDPLFMRAPGGVQPTPRADRLAEPVRQALAALEQALGDSAAFDPLRSRRTFQLHMSDIGEARFLPELVTALRERAPGARVETRPLPREQITTALDSGRIDFAFGFLPMLRDTQRIQLLDDRYVLLLRRGHPFAARRRTGRALLGALRELEFVAVRAHADTRRILELLQLEERLRLVTEHFLALPSLVRASDLAAVVPRNIAQGFGTGYAIVEPPFPLRDFTVSLHWSRRFEADPGHRWMRELVGELFCR